MVNIVDYVNVRYSTRNLQDAQFEALLPHLAQAFAQLNFVPIYTDKELHADWQKLCSWTSSDSSINSTSRIGLKLCEHFFPNFYDIETHDGKSFHNLWTPTNLEKVLRWNRNSHSTPYLSEIRRGIYFCCGLPKSTMYRPQMMKLACMRYGSTRVLDPCAGWGGRMLGAVAAGCHYTAFEPNTVTYSNLNKLVQYLDIGNSVTLYCDDARNIDKYAIDKVDLILTSPPYFDLEVYSHEDTQSVHDCDSYDKWCNEFLHQVIESCISYLTSNGVSCWNVGKVRGRDMADDIQRIHQFFGYEKNEILSVISSKRQINQISAKNAKNSDDTVVYKKKF